MYLAVFENVVLNSIGKLFVYFAYSKSISTISFYSVHRREPRELNRLIPWLNRELQVLLDNDASQIAYVLRIILEALTEFDIRSSEFRDLVRPYFNTFTDHFVHELLNYARTNFDLVGYDQSVTYLPQGI